MIEKRTKESEVHTRDSRHTELTYVKKIERNPVIAQTQ